MGIRLIRLIRLTCLCLVRQKFTVKLGAYDKFSVMSTSIISNLCYIQQGNKFKNSTRESQHQIGTTYPRHFARTHNKLAGRVGQTVLNECINFWLMHSTNGGCDAMAAGAKRPFPDAGFPGSWRLFPWGLSVWRKEVFGLKKANPPLNLGHVYRQLLAPTIVGGWGSLEDLILG